ncbi:MAG: GlsB/YeaQ/YmgE family stress response membrane protein [Actinomycetota bacterium]
MGSHSEAAPLAFVPLLAQNGDRIRLDLDISSILTYIVIGLIVGVLARLLVPGRTSMSLLATLVIGVIGAVIGGWLAGAVFEETEGVDWIASILVALVLVLLVRRGSRRRTLWSRR